MRSERRPHSKRVDIAEGREGRESSGGRCVAALGVGQALCEALGDHRSVGVPAGSAIWAAGGGSPGGAFSRHAAAMVAQQPCGSCDVMSRIPVPPRLNATHLPTWPWAQPQTLAQNILVRTAARCLARQDVGASAQGRQLEVSTPADSALG